MRILHIFDHSLPLHSGYTFRSRSILREQNRRGWETVHLTTQRHIHPGPNPETVEDGLIFHRTPPSAPASGLLRRPPLAEMQATARALDALIRSSRPDILHAHSPVLNAWPMLWAARRHRLPTVYEMRATWEDAAVAHGTARPGGPRYILTRWAETLAARRVDALGCICAGLQGDMIARGIRPDKVFLTPNAVDIEQFPGAIARDEALALQLGLADHDVVGFLGSFYDYEGLDDLVTAMAQARAKAPRLRLLLVGGGPQEEALRRQITALGLEDIVIMTGRVPHQQIDRYYSLVDVLAYPRKRSRLTDLVTPLKPLEAMAQSKLVVASDVGGHRELIVSGRTGELFPADDPVALADVLERMFANRTGWPTYHAAGLAYVRTERTWARTVDHYQPVYERLLNRSRRSS